MKIWHFAVIAAALLFAWRWLGDYPTIQCVEWGSEQSYTRHFGSTKSKGMDVTYKAQPCTKVEKQP